MSFLSPLFLLGFGLLAPLVAVYLLKVRPRKHPTAALFLWDEILSQKKASALLQRLRDLLSLLLLALAAVALVLAAAGLRFGDADARDTLVLVDRSVSMNANADPARPGVSRFEAAVDRARGLVAAASGERRVAVATVDDTLDFASFLTDRPRRLRQALDALEPGQTANAAAAFAGLADLTSTTDADAGLRVVLLTDGVGLPPVPAGVEVVRVDATVAPANLGLTAADLVATGPGGSGSGGVGGEATLFFATANAGPEPVEAELTLTPAEPADAAPLLVLPLTLAPGENPARLTGVLAPPGRHVLRLRRAGGNDRADALPDDDEAFLTLAAPRRCASPSTPPTATSSRPPSTPSPAPATRSCSPRPASRPTSASPAASRARARAPKTTLRSPCCSRPTAPAPA